jgi:hypothetical protein
MKQASFMQEVDVSISKNKPCEAITNILLTGSFFSTIEKQPNK